MNIILQWADALWILIALLIAHKGQRFWSIGAILAGMFMLRLQTELMTELHYPHGMLGMIDSHVFYRGLAMYSLTYASYLTLLYYTPRTQGAFLIGTSVSAFFTGLFLSSFIMIL